MVFKHSSISALAGISFLLVFLVSCEEELDTLGDGVIASEPFVTGKADFDVFAFNRSAVAVQTNRLPLYQIGVYNDPLYGRREAVVTSQITFPALQGDPVFGNTRQNLEDLPEASRGQDTIPENETVREVILYLPYQLVNSNANADTDGDGVPNELDIDPDDPNSDTDGDGVSDNDERIVQSDPFDADEDGTGDDFIAGNFIRSFALDSIFSRRFVGLEGQAPYLGEQLDLKVERSTFFLRDLDPNSNFEESQEYFSNTDITTFVEGEPLFEGTVTIDNKEIVTFQEDNPDTLEDESVIVSTRLNPGVEVALNTQFFQENILDKEGSFDLLTQSNFSNFLRGFHLSITPVNEDLMILFDLSQATITITYEFDDFVRDDSGEGTTETIERVERDFVLNFLQVQNNLVFGNAVNTFIDAPLPSNVEAQLDDDQSNANRLFLKGGSGTFSELRLFDQDESMANDIIEDIRANNWIINEANLVFYVDRDAIDIVGGTLEPEQLYLFDSRSNLPLFDNSSVNGFASVLDLLRETFGGNLEKSSDGRGTKYTMRVTDYINDLIVRDSILAPINLSLSSSLLVTNTLEAESAMGETVDLPVMNTLNPFGTILFGNNVPAEEEDKRLKLQIFFTETD
ncbi:MAG: DUF4270 family protein [Bacteroidota bacterium]